MFGLTGTKAKKTANGNAASTNQRDKRRYGPPQMLGTVCPEIGEQREKFYEAPAVAVAQDLKELVMSEDGAGSEVLRCRWQFSVAIESINLLDNYPIQATVAVHGEHKWDFHRAVFLRGLVAGMGEWIHASQFTDKAGKPLDPFSNGWDRIVRLGTPKSGYDPQKIAQTVGDLMFALDTGILALADQLHPGVRGLFYDSFAVEAHPRNVIALSIDKAQTKAIKQYRAKGHALQREPGMRTLNQELLRELQKERLAEAPVVSSEPEAPAGGQEPVQAPVQEILAPEPKAPEPAPAPVNDPPREMRSAKELQKHGIEGAAKPQKTSPELIEDLEPEDLVTVVRSRLKSGVLGVNKEGATIQVTSYGAAVVFPVGCRLIAECMNTSQDAVTKLLEEKMIEPGRSTPNVVFRIQRKGRGRGKVKMMVLKPEWERAIFPDGSPVINPYVDAATPES